MSDELPRVVLLPRRARPFHGRHPWVFAGAIGAVEGDPADGDEVDLVTDTGVFVARGSTTARARSASASSAGTPTRASTPTSSVRASSRRSACATGSG